MARVSSSESSQGFLQEFFWGVSCQCCGGGGVTLSLMTRRPFFILSPWRCYFFNLRCLVPPRGSSLEGCSQKIWGSGEIPESCTKKAPKCTFKSTTIEKAIQVLKKIKLMHVHHGVAWLTPTHFSNILLGFIAQNTVCTYTRQLTRSNQLIEIVIKL